jgi:hypothetical protein
MAAPADVIAEMKTLGIGKDVDDDLEEIPEESEVNGFSGKHASSEEVVKHRQTIVEISKMADKMSALVQEIRNTSKETDDRLRQMETDIQILGLEE